MARDLFESNRPLLVLVNPTAGRGRARRRAERLARALAERAVPHRVVATDGPGHAQELARTAAAGVVAVGGDGTVNEVLNGLPLRDGAHGPLAVLPAGSGDDFAAGAGFADDVDALAQRLLAGDTRLVDCGEAALTVGGAATTRRFANEVGVGFEADVVRAARGVPLRGRLLYVAATLRALLRQRAFTAELALDGAPAPPRELLFASFCNGPRVGGGLPFAPDAALDDGLLDLLDVGATSRAGTLSLLGKLVRRRHRGDPRVRVTRLQTAALTCRRPVRVAMDGELVAEAATEVRVRVLPAALRLCGVR